MAETHLNPVVSDGSRLAWLALAVIPLGWLSAVGVIQHLHRNNISSGRSHRGGLDPDAELVRGKPFPVTLDFFHALESPRRQLRHW